jgi:hypothetical protein
MAFSDFTFPQVQQDLGLTIDEADLYGSIPAVALREDFATTLTEGVTVALAVNTEKAKSEFIIAPVLLEVRRLCRGTVGLFSGVALDVDPAKGLNGICDFLLSKTARQFILSAPVVVVVEAKNDNLRTSLGPCIATTYAAALYNQRAESPLPAVFGVVTTGSAWQFLRLVGTTVTIDLREYYIDNLGKLIGVLTHLIQHV